MPDPDAPSPARRDIHVVAVAAELLDEVGAFINDRELTVCSEMHSTEAWPSCRHVGHDDARRMLAKLGVEPS